ncbi:MAG: glutamyl-tRNA reductase [Chloroflexi bacterium]|nr:glutamyl-tRNA reductase [Chloroflexota bacterium]
MSFSDLKNSAGNDKVSIISVCVTHKRCPVDIREKLAVPPRMLGECLMRLLSICRESEFFILSTCNRTEIYTASFFPDEIKKSITSFLAGYGGFDGPEILSRGIEIFEGEKAVEHLVRVACGLESQVPGDGQVLGQVREAHGAALKSSALGPYLDRLVRDAITGGKRARSKTGIGKSGTSISSAAVGMARDKLGGLKGRSILILGSGKMGIAASVLIKKHGAKQVIAANHNYEKALETASRFGGKAIRYDAVEDEIAACDIVISSTAAPHYVLKKDLLERAVSKRNGKPLVIIDIAVPRDVDPAAGSLENIHLFNIDDLSEVIDNNLNKFMKEIPVIEEIVNERKSSYMDWLEGYRRSHIIRTMRGRCEAIRKEETENLLNRLSHLTPEDRDKIEVATHAIINKVLHAPSLALKYGEYNDDQLSFLLEFFGTDEKGGGK